MLNWFKKKKEPEKSPIDLKIEKAIFKHAKDVDKQRTGIQLAGNKIKKFRIILKSVDEGKINIILEGIKGVIENESA